MAISKPEVYNGKEPFVFISYSHEDTDRVMPIIDQLQSKGVRVWYDNGIKPGVEWARFLTGKIGECACVLCLISKNFVQSEDCETEVYLARTEKKGPVVAYLENAQLSLELKYHIGRLHALNLAQIGSVQGLVDQLVQTEMIQKCRAVRAPAVTTQTAPKAMAAPQPPKQEPQRTAQLSDAEIEKMSGKQLYVKSQMIALQANAKTFTDESFRLMEAAANKGYLDAMWEIGRFYYIKGSESERARDFMKAVEYEEKTVYWWKKHIRNRSFSFDEKSRNEKEGLKLRLENVEESLGENKKRLKRGR